MTFKTLATAFALAASLAGCGTHGIPTATDRTTSQAAAQSYANPNGPKCDSAGNHTYIDPALVKGTCVTPPSHHYGD